MQGQEAIKDLNIWAKHINKKGQQSTCPFLADSWNYSSEELSLKPLSVKDEKGFKSVNDKKWDVFKTTIFSTFQKALKMSLHSHSALKSSINNA